MARVSKQDKDTFSTGDRVVLTSNLGIVTECLRAGNAGVVTGFDEESHRVAVKLDKDDAPVRNSVWLVNYDELAPEPKQG